MEDRCCQRRTKKRETIKRETNEKVSTIFALKLNHILALNHHWGIRLLWLVRVISKLDCAWLTGSTLVRMTFSTSLWDGLDWSRFDLLDPILSIVLELYYECVWFIIILKLWFSVENEGHSFHSIQFFLLLFSCSFCIPFIYSHFGFPSFHVFSQTTTLTNRP